MLMERRKIAEFRLDTIGRMGTKSAAKPEAEGAKSGDAVARTASAAEASKSPRGLTYAQAGVDMDAGDRVVDLIKPALRRTQGPRVMGAYGGFGAMFRLDFKEPIFRRNYKDPVLVACTDGVGTKVMLAIQMGRLDTIGIDCVAMNVNDLIVQGAEPLFFLDYLGLSRIRPEETASIIQGVARGCEIAGCALIGGECAEMPDIYKAGDFDIAGFAVGVVEAKRAIDPGRVKKGDVIVGLPSSGVHSNGYALVRRIVKEAGLDLAKHYDGAGPGTLGELLLEPTRIYAKAVLKALGAYRRKRAIRGMAHITGAGLPGNLPRAFGEHLDAVVDRDAWQVPPLFRFLQQHGGVEESEMWNVFNMGVGYCLIVHPEFVEGVMKKLRKAGERPFVMGKITKGSGRVLLK
jgi:phosphoribosylformylglycinamidine cyclo-ligase